VNAFTASNLLSQRARQLGFAKELLQSLIIVSELPADVREIRFMEIARDAQEALKGRLAA